MSALRYAGKPVVVKSRIPQAQLERFRALKSRAGNLKLSLNFSELVRQGVESQLDAVEQELVAREGGRSVAAPAKAPAPSRQTPPPPQFETDFSGTRARARTENLGSPAGGGGGQTEVEKATPPVKVVLPPESAGMSDVAADIMSDWFKS